jgi:serine protease Do
MQRPIKRLATGGALVALGALTGWSVPALVRTSIGAPATAAAATLPAVASPDSITAGGAPNYRAIFQQNEAAVVGITSAGETQVADSRSFDFGNLFGFEPFGQDGSHDGSDEPFSQFFHRSPTPHGQVPTRALGSGFIISPDGLILTNAHVVDGAQQVTVTLSDHREYKAKVLGADRTSDIAVLKIDAGSLPTVRLGNSDQLQVGDYVMAIGAPFGLSESATAGIVSAKGRSLPDDGYVPFIQTDAAVNPGNSGGPLFNSSGAVVGINSQIYSNSGGYQGVAFAIPINLAEQIEHQIVTTGKVTHGRLGVEVQNVSQPLAQSFKLRSPAGALVSQVEPDSAAARAGLKPGDVILAYNGTPISDAGQLSARVNMTAPGEHATLEVWRAGKPMSVDVTVSSTSAGPTAVASASASDHTHLGLTLRPLTSAEREQAGLTHGLVVEDVQGHAAEAGIQQGDVVLAVDGTPVQSVEQLRALLHQHDQQVALLLQRGQNRIYVAVELG